MKPVSFLFATVLATSVVMLAPPPTVEAAASSVSGADVLTKLDKLAVRFPSQTYTATMEIYKSGTLRTTMEFGMWMKDLEKQFIHFTAPGDVAGMKILMEDRDTIYMYTPEFKKVRRVAAHMQNQGFLGSEFTPEDMVMAKLSPNFDATLIGQKGTETQLDLKPKEGSAISYSKLEVFVDSTVKGVTRIHYFDKSGNHVRTQTREQWQDFEDTKIPTQIRMKNLKTGDETVIHLSGLDVKTQIDDSLFSRRMLMRG